MNRMKRIKLLLLLPVLMMVLLFSAMNYKPKKVILFGDSITQFGTKPGGYVDLLQKALDPAKYEVTGSGIGGNKVYDLYLRMEEDVLNKKPDLVVIYIGVNDVWHKLKHRTGTDYPKFIQFYQALIDKMKAKGIKIVLCTPAVIGEKKDAANEMDTELNRYSDAIRGLAVKNSLPIADLRKLFTSYVQENNPENTEKGILTTDGVHLNDKGNRMLADTLLPFIK